MNLGLGFGAVIGSIAGFKFADTKEEESKRIARALRDQYPLNNFRKTFKLIQSSGIQGMIFLQNFNTNLIHHIGNRYTLRDLGFFGLPVDTVSDQEFENFQRGETYLTRGEVGE